MGMDDLTIGEETPMPNTPATTAPGGVPATGNSKIESYNPEFEGLGYNPYKSRVVLDGNQILFKNEDRYVNEAIVRLTGGRKVHQIFLEDQNTYVKSYDGKFTEDNEPFANYKGWRLMYELDWVSESETGDITEYQLVLSPTGRYAFVEYANALMALCNKKVTEVDTVITAVRDQNKDGQRYSKPVFMCAELKALNWSPKGKK